MSVTNNRIACEVAKSNLLYPECRIWCEAASSRPFNDENKKVRSEARRVFLASLAFNGHSPHELRNADLELSRETCIADEPTYLLHAVEETRHRVPEVSVPASRVS